MKKLQTLLIFLLSLISLSATAQKTGTIPPIFDDETAGPNSPLSQSMETRIFRIEKWLERRDLECGKKLAQGNLVEKYQALSLEYPLWESELAKFNDQCNEKYTALKDHFKCMALLESKNVKKIKSTISDPEFTKTLGQKYGVTDEQASKVQSFYHLLFTKPAP
jgi:hypothetical protein